MTRTMVGNMLPMGLILLLAAGCGDGKKSDPVCGDDEINGTEVCDGSDLGGQTCESLSLGSGDLACSDSCRWDTSGCETASVCGDGIITGDESCDGTELGGQTCELLGLGSGDLACSDSCGWDTSGCETASVCGDGVVTGDEVCDGTNLGTPARTCEDEGFDTGVLACNETCDGFDTTGCTSGAVCGDGEISGDEVCDGTNLGTPARTCVDEGFLGGDLACLDTCLAFDVTACTNVSSCGNDAVEFPEECDGSVPEGVDCTTRGFYGGTVACNADCTLDVSSCDEGYCGDGTLNGPEQCDTTDLGSPTATCSDAGFTGGDLACNADCTLDVSSCTGGCGNGIQEGSETCDGADVGTRTCVDEGFLTGTLGCQADCSAYDTSGCLDDPVCTVDGAELGDIHIGDIMLASGDTTDATDDVTVSCQEDPTSVTNDVAFEITVMQRGVLTVQTDNYWHVVALFAEADSTATCYTDEYICWDPYFYGNPMNLGTVEPGRYYIVVSDWNAEVSMPFAYTVTLTAPGAEVCHNTVDDDGDTLVDCDDDDCTASTFCGGETGCTNGADDDHDFLVDCVDTDCVGTTDCTGSDCAADEDLGTLVYGETVTRTVNMSEATNDLSLSCSASDGTDHVMQFTLSEEAPVNLVFEQDTGAQHSLGLYMQAGTGSGCTDGEFLCLDYSAATSNPAFDGSLGTFPAGTYYLIVEATTASTGSFTAELTIHDDSEIVCDDGLDEDGDGDVDCADTECLGNAACLTDNCTADHDFGTVSIGDTVTHTGDTSTSANTVNLGCATSDGNDYAVSFTLETPAMVYTEIDQASGSGHATSLIFAGPADGSCTDGETLCLDLSGGDYSPDASGFLSYPDPLPAGTYYMIAEAVGTAGTVDFLFTAYETSETSCEDGADNDGDGAVDCDDTDCAEEAICIESDCDDGVDNDGDELTDCQDPDCAEETVCEGAVKGIWEYFGDAEADTVDLAGGMLVFTPASWHPQGYVWAFTPSIPSLPVTAGTGSTTQTLTLGDDDAAIITFSTFSDGFDLYGVNHGVLNVSSNGLLTLGDGNENSSFSPGTGGLFAQPAIAPLWSDFSPDTGGTVSYDEFADRAVVTFDAIPEYYVGGSSTFQAVLWADGHITLAWQDLTCSYGMAGLSNGGGSASVPAETDFY